MKTHSSDDDLGAPNPECGRGKKNNNTLQESLRESLLAVGCLILLPVCIALWLLLGLSLQFLLMSAAVGCYLVFQVLSPFVIAAWIVEALGAKTRPKGVRRRNTKMGWSDYVIAIITVFGVIGLGGYFVYEEIRANNLFSYVDAERLIEEATLHPLLMIGAFIVFVVQVTRDFSQQNASI